MFIHTTYIEAVENESPTENGTIRLLKNIKSIKDVGNEAEFKIQAKQDF